MQNNIFEKIIRNARDVLQCFGNRSGVQGSRISEHLKSSENAPTNIGIRPQALIMYLH